MEQDLIMLQRVWWLTKGLIEYMFSPYAWYRNLRGGTWVTHVYPEMSSYRWWIRISDCKLPEARIR